MSITTTATSPLAPDEVSAAESGPSSHRAVIAWIAGVIVLTFPSLAYPYVSGLDPSWVIGLSEAVDRGLVFGRDVGFTYGPLGHMFFPLNKGTAPTATALLLLALYAAWWASLGLVVVRLHGTRAALFATGIAVALGIAAHTPNVILLANAGFLASALASRRVWQAAPAAFLTAVGLLGKFNIGAACLGSFLVYLALLPLGVGFRRATSAASSLLGLLAASLVLLFAAADGPISNLPTYFSTYAMMAGGYSSQMAISHQSERLLRLLMVALAASLLVPLIDRRTWKSYASLLAILSPSFFITYKGMLVRCDDWHFIPGLSTTVALTCLLLVTEPGRRGRALFASLIPALALGYLIALAFSPQASPKPSRTMPFDGPRNIATLLDWEGHRRHLREQFEDFCQSEALPSNIRSKLGDAPVDVYPWEIALVPANGLNWDPRYVLQSYQAFHPTLDAMCAEHYRGQQAPRFVLYRHESIDNQHPCLVDSRTWLAIYRWYDLVEADDREETLLLERRSAPRFGDPVPLESRTVEVGQEIVLPQAGDGLLLIQADLEMKSVGKLQELLYKVNPPLLRVDYADGSTNFHTLVWKNLAASPAALISQLPRKPASAAATFRGERPDRVRSITILAHHRCFKREVPVQFFQAQFTKDVNPGRVSSGLKRQ